MKNILRFLATALTAATLAAPAWAVPAKHGVLTVSQPDGTTLRVRLSGDEWNHTYLTEDGYPLVESDGIFSYAAIAPDGSLTASPMRAADIERRSPETSRWLKASDPEATLRLATRKSATRRTNRVAARSKGLFSEAKFPSKGKQKALVILVEYKDVKFTLSNPHDYFTRMLNEPGFADYGGTGSARDYFLHCSTGQFDPEFTLLGPVTLENNMSFYGGNNSNGDDKNPHRMAVEACRQLDAVVDFSEYDRDGDGFIDNIFIFYAGRGEASGGGANTVWPHTWYVTQAESTPYVFDGVILDRYACSNEWEEGAPDGVGTFCHEFSHVLGLPDLYATSYSSAFTPGDWALMDHGSYNNKGRTPPAYSVFERYTLGWIAPRELKGPANVTLRDISSNTACIIKTIDENEFYLLENRAQTGWDTYLPGHGMLAWHIHYDATQWKRNTVNNDASHQYIDLIEADNIRSDETRNADPFPGPAGVTSFGDFTTPAMSTWCGTRIGLPLTEITETGRTITFKVDGGVPSLPDVNLLPATDINPGGFTLNWEPVEGAESYDIEIFTQYSSDNGRPVMSYVNGYSPRNVGNVTSWKVDNLEPSTTYCVTLTAVSPDSAGNPSEELAVTTLEATFEYLTPQADEATEVTSESFTANWKPFEGAGEYLLDVYTYIYGEPESTVADFTDGLAALAASGWATDSKMTIANTDYAGADIPALRLSTDGSYLDSPTFADGLRAVSFWHRGIGSATGNTLEVRVLAQGAWKNVASVPVTSAKGGATTLIDNLPAGAQAVRIVYSRPAGGSVAIDDVNAMHGGERTEAPLEGYAACNTGASLCETVENLTPGETYCYRVTAVDADGTRSRRSNEITVTTRKSDGIGATTATRQDWFLSGRTLFIGTPGDYAVADVAGRIVARGNTTGAATVNLPSAGIYIVRAADRAFKIIVR